MKLLTKITKIVTYTYFNNTMLLAFHTCNLMHIYNLNKFFSKYGEFVQVFPPFYSCFFSHQILNSHIYFKIKCFNNSILKNTDLAQLHSSYTIRGPASSLPLASAGCSNLRHLQLSTPSSSCHRAEPHRPFMTQRDHAAQKV